MIRQRFKYPFDQKTIGTVSVPQGDSTKEDVKLFGLPAEKGRWLFILLGIITSMSLGTIYSWSVFKKPLENLFHISATESGLPYMVFLAVFAIVMPIAGRLLKRYKPRTIAIIGGLVVGAGWVLSSFAPNITALIITYGIVAGAGVGLIYGVPIAVATKWFPDKKGLAVGLTIAGFGMSPIVIAPLSNMLIGSFGPLQAFSILGMPLVAVIIMMSVFLKFPNDGWKPSKYDPVKANHDCDDVDCSTMLKKSNFHGLWLCYVIGTLSGLMAIGIASPVGQEIIKLSPELAALSVGIFAVFNGIGRPIFGWMTDRITPKYSAIISFVIIVVASLGMMYAREGDVLLYMVSFSGLWLTLGGWLAIAPTSTATFFGPSNYTSNYGMVFTAYGAGAVIGTLVSGQIRDVFGSYANAFYPTAALAVIGMIIAVLLMKLPKK